MEIFRFKSDIPFMRYARGTTVVSAITFALAVFFLVTRGLNFGIEFTGGTEVELHYQSPPDLVQLQETLHGLGLGGATAQAFGTSSDIMLKLPPRPNEDASKQSAAVFNAIHAKDSTVELRRVEFIGAQVGSELVKDGLIALGLVCAGIMLYLASRFEWRFAVAAIIANLHDVVIILGFFAYFQWDFSITVLAGVLAVLGYSVNESVVVFDRVRENLRKVSKRTIAETIDNAITATMSRTIITHACTQMMVTSILFFGGEVLHNFALALTIGICFGIYSSVLVASPIAMWLGISRDKFVKKPTKEGRAA